MNCVAILALETALLSALCIGFTVNMFFSERSIFILSPGTSFENKIELVSLVGSISNSFHVLPYSSVTCFTFSLP